MFDESDERSPGEARRDQTARTPADHGDAQSAGRRLYANPQALEPVLSVAAGPLGRVSDGPTAAAGGVVRLYGHWTPVNRGTTGAGSIVFKVENRHTLGTDIAPQALGPSAGVAGLTARRSS